MLSPMDQTSNHLMEEQRKPEIEEADLTPMVLDIAAFGESDIYQMDWLTEPLEARYTVPANCSTR